MSQVVLTRARPRLQDQTSQARYRRVQVKGAEVPLVPAETLRSEPRGLSQAAALGAARSADLDLLHHLVVFWRRAGGQVERRLALDSVRRAAKRARRKLAKPRP